MDENPPIPDLEWMLGTAAEAISAANQDPELSRRLARADTSVAIHITDTDAGLTALLDRHPVEAVEQALETAETHIYGSARDWGPVFSGEVLPGIALAEGRLSWTGPVRKTLRVFPILRALYTDVLHGEIRTAVPATPPAGE